MKLRLLAWKIAACQFHCADEFCAWDFTSCQLLSFLGRGLVFPYSKGRIAFCPSCAFGPSPEKQSSFSLTSAFRHWWPSQQSKTTIEDSAELALTPSSYGLFVVCLRDLSLVVEAEDKACQHLSLVEEEGEDVAELA